MKILLYSDNHFSTYSSILRTRGEKYSTRLDNQIASLNWVEDTANSYGCEEIICLGDFFDRPELSAEEISALKEIVWNNNIRHTFLVGNHEISSGDNVFSSSNVFGFNCNADVIASPCCFTTEDGCEICLLPYMTERNRKSIVELFGEKGNKRRVILSHNDIKGINYGNVISSIGYSLDEIEPYCDLFINGHIHNEGQFGKIINIGNLTGQNFSENGFKYHHRVLIVDTKDFHVMAVINPNAINFEKIEWEDALNNLYPPNSVVSIKCKEKDRPLADKFQDENIIMKRVVVEYEPSEVKKEENKIEIDHIKMFRDYCLETIGDSEILKEELSYVCR